MKFHIIFNKNKKKKKQTLYLIEFLYYKYYFFNTTNIKPFECTFCKTFYLEHNSNLSINVNLSKRKYPDKYNENREFTRKIIEESKKIR